jgi:hypothetical protein
MRTPRRRIGPRFRCEAIAALPERSPVRALLTNKGDVIICGLPRYRGARDCIFINDKGTLPHSWWNNIESYRWVTRTECLKAGPLPIQPGATYGASAQQCGGTP